MKKILIVGGGLAGLISAIILARKGIEVLVVERKVYPFHRVCGEYISNETIPFLKSLKLLPEEFSPSQINRLQLSAISGKNEILPLDLGGFGISRYILDNFLYSKAQEAGAEFWLNTDVENVSFQDNKFAIATSRSEVYADIVIGAFGKRSKMDVHLNRSFIQKRSPYVGIKYHLKTDHPHDLIALHNFPGGYCGMSNIEEGKTNLCYLTHRDNVKKYKNIREMEEAVLFKNPLLESVFKNADFLFEKPEVINEISFETKSLVDNHILMAGDAAGMITPLCGNGMAMAIHASKILSELVIRYCEEESFSREQLEKNYIYQWRKNFAGRIWAGRQIQKLFGNEWASNVAINLAINVKPVARIIMRNTHGEVF
ncbi:NAD(P)/FAD-dependent oxidoreductase [Ohtaekwangia koreensis]|uniref:Dehydrogenase (Flavoprotein) n=1 Tax=Ohtaekwangia koreensis TaxID=688867 RepID=A0A1T5LGB5_9BACT|nr:NAD(P)/FAD-dependent oxidoreductase [Ohtaekwangia koreensis]SKC74735.1 Dehydrogenase (flavoprotein) [Ohtaekwangia koreensis]